MAIIYTIGFTKKSLEDFIKLLKDNGITKVIDIRLNRTSQLAGFAKEKDLRYILEKMLNISYQPIEDFAPTKQILSKYMKDNDWNSYELSFNSLIKDRKIEKFKHEILNNEHKICFLCAEQNADKCHRRLIAEFFAKLQPDVQIKHL